MSKQIFPLALILLCNWLFSPAFSQCNVKFASKNPIHAYRFNSKLIGRKITADSSTSKMKTNKIPTTALVGSVSFGLIGAMIGSNTKSHTVGSSDFIQIRTGDGQNAKVGASIGGSVGTILGCIARRDKIKSRHKYVKIIAGSVLGGIAGYHLADYTFGFSTVLLPPISTSILLKF